MSNCEATINTSTNIQNRDNHIDTIKFLLIFSIYIFHFGKAGGNLYPFINIYQVPLFFLISGFWALNRIDEKSIFEFIYNAFKKYIIYWFSWVLIYTSYFTVQNTLSFVESKEIFIRYFYSVKSTGILGMWFTPAFFCVSLVYFLFAKLCVLIKIPKKVIAWIGLILFFIVFYLTKYYCKIPSDLIFSIGYVTEYLFYFSAGAVAYLYISKGRTLLKTSLLMKILNILIVIVAFACFWLYFFKKENLIWYWTYNIFDGKLSFVPTFVTVFLMYFLISGIAKGISCDLPAKIGRNTLGLCHCEMFTKEILVSFGSFLGVTLKPVTPIESIIFAFFALVVGFYLILPVTDTIVKRILLVSS